MSGDIVHPTERIKRSVLVTVIALGLVIRDLWKMRALADQARDIERGMRVRHASEIEDQDERHQERMRKLTLEIAELRRRGFAPAPLAAVDATADEDDVEPGA